MKASEAQANATEIVRLLSGENSSWIYYWDRNTVDEGFWLYEFLGPVVAAVGSDTIEYASGILKSISDSIFARVIIITSKNIIEASLEPTNASRKAAREVEVFSRSQVKTVQVISVSPMSSYEEKWPGSISISVDVGRSAPIVLPLGGTASQDAAADLAALVSQMPQ